MSSLFRISINIVVYFGKGNVKSQFALKILSIAISLVLLKTLFSKCHFVANAVRWGGPMVLWEKPKTASRAILQYCVSITIEIPYIHTDFRYHNVIYIIPIILSYFIL